MCNDLSFKKQITVIAKACLVYGLLTLSAGADDAMTIDDYIDEARPYLHLSCAGAWDTSGENDEEYINIVNRFVAITFINHDFDVARVNNAPEADQERLRKLFYDEVGKTCRERPQRLLAGVVDRSLVAAFDKVKPEADHDAD